VGLEFLAAAMNKLTTDLADRIVAIVKAGSAVETAARACGVARRTWYRWLKLGRGGRQPYRRLVEQLESAEDACKVSLITVLRAAAAQDWRAALVILERKWPEEWGRRDRHEVSHDGLLGIGPMTPAERARLRRISARLASAEELPGGGEGDVADPRP